ncbi:hypothetical protein V6N13_081771 [Hibiscus sabdariffa]
MHRFASLRLGHAQSVVVFVTPGRPTTRGFGLVDARSRSLCATCLDNVTPNAGSPCVGNYIRGVSRPSNVRASDMIDISVARAGPPTGSGRGPMRIVVVAQARAFDTPVETSSPRSWNPARAISACFGSSVLQASACGLPIRPVLKHGPRSLTCVRVNGLENP